MKTIEQRLKSDAQAFYQEPEKGMRNIIMEKINSHENLLANSDNKHNILRWLLPTSSAIAALLILVMNINSGSNQQNYSTKINLGLIALVSFKIESLPLSIEEQLTNDLKVEQLALVKDIKYIQSRLLESFDI